MLNPIETINLISINIEGNKHLPEVTQFLSQQNADAILIQEGFKLGIESLSNSLKMNYIFSPMAVRPSDYREGIIDQWGVAILSPHQIQSPKKDYYGGSENLHRILTVGPKGEPLFDAARALTQGTVVKNNTPFNLATTHFTWTPDGSASDQQRADLDSLLALLSDNESLIFAGDFNAPRDGEIHRSLIERGMFRYWIPPDVNTTIDDKFHRVKGLQLVVDHLLTRGDHYSVTNARVAGGISDHLAILAQVSSTTNTHLIRNSLPNNGVTFGSLS